MCEDSRKLIGHAMVERNSWRYSRSLMQELTAMNQRREVQRVPSDLSRSITPLIEVPEPNLTQDMRSSNWFYTQNLNAIFTVSGTSC